MLPSGPFDGEKSSATVQKPFSSQQIPPPLDDLQVDFRLLDHPFCPLSLCPLPNWGLTRQTKHAPSLRRRQATGRTRVRGDKWRHRWR